MTSLSTGLGASFLAPHPTTTKKPDQHATDRASPVAVTIDQDKDHSSKAKHSDFSGSRDTQLGHESKQDGRSSSSAESEQRERQLEKETIDHIQALKRRDREVRAHERAHAAVGGQYAGSPSYSYQHGPDGVMYAIGGKVMISTSKINGNPEATLAKMMQVQRAALAPAQPSAQDRQVAAQAAQMAAQARSEILEQKRDLDQSLLGATSSDQSMIPSGRKNQRAVNKNIEPQAAEGISQYRRIQAINGLVVYRGDDTQFDGSSLRARA